jgi:hypothetical protein
MDNRQHIRRVLQNRINSRVEILRQSGSYPSERDEFVISEMQDLEIVQLAHGFRELVETLGLL